MKMMRMKKSILAVSTIALLSGCSLVPDYLQPAMPTPQSWSGGEYVKENAAIREGEKKWGDVAWKDYFTNPAMQKMIGQALENNRDLRVAVLNVEAARAAYGVQRSELFPSIDANGSGSVQRIGRTMSAQTADKGMINRSYGLTADVTAWELDLFGRVRSLNEQALEQYLATEEAHKASQITLIAEVANAHLTLLADKKLLNLTKETFEAQKKSLELTERIFQLGMGNELEVSQAKSALETARVNQAIYARLVEQDKTALMVLLGGPVSDDLIDAAVDLDQIAFIEKLPVGLPSDVLRNRPDVVAAEHNLKAANANIGAARAAFFPIISLTANGGTGSSSLDNLFDAGTGTWLFAPKITMPIFNYGRTTGNLDAAHAKEQIALAEYEKSIQTAFKEVSDALVAKTALMDQLQAQQSLVAATQRSFDLSDARYRRGVDNYLVFLDSQRSLFSAQQQLVSTQLQQLSNLVNLYKVLGGGQPEQPAEQKG